MSSAVIVLAAVVTLAAAPHDPGLSSLRVERVADAFVVHAAFANDDFRAAVAIDADNSGAIDAAELAAAQPLLERTVAPAFALGGRGPLSIVAVLADNDDVELLLRFVPVPEGVLTAPFLERLSRGHRCYVAVVDAADAIISDALLSPLANEFMLPELSAPASGFGQAGLFFLLGVEHILLGFDHLAFLLALLAAGVTLGRALWTITAFTVAHSLTLIGASLGVVGLPSLLVEAIIAASIVWVAAANLLSKSSTAPHRWPLALGFGLVHGFGFAGVLADLDVGAATSIVPLLTFNLGVEVGQLLFALLVVPMLWLVGLTVHGPRARAFVSITVGLAGIFWFVERVPG